jgi:UDP:flavonoid glycosyltransferase YjiC (YdhE family)
MRVLLSCSLGGEGHLIPLATVGRAIQRAGHEVLLLVPPALAQSAERTGLPFRVGDEPDRTVVDEIWRRVRVGPPEAVAGLIDRELFANQCTERMLVAAREEWGSWRPGFVVRESCEYASAVVAHEKGAGQAQVGVSLADLEFGVRAMVTPIVERFAPGVADAIGSAPYLSSFPASLDPSPWPDTRRFRAPSGITVLGGGSQPRSDDPLVYVTFGTVLGHLPEARGVYRAALQAVCGLAARVLVTVGHTTDLEALGPVPENTCVTRWIDQDSVLREAAAVVCHGGSGTTLGALAAGVPLVLCPLFADQGANARVVQAAGAGLVVASTESTAGGLRTLTPDDVASLRTGIECVLGDPAYRCAAGRAAAEIAAMPELNDVVTDLL